MAPMQQDRVVEPNYGRRLVPNVIDETAERYPQRECFSIPQSSNPQDGWEPITFKSYAKAINFIAHLIIDQCGKSTDDTFPTLAYIGPNDAGYVVFLVAAIKAGYKALFISPRNSSEAQMNLFHQTECRFIFCPASHRAMVDPWLQQRDIQAIELEPIKSLFLSHDVPQIPYEKTFEEAEWAPLAVLHTSGSTGHPKPVIVKQGMLAIGDAYHDLPDWNGRPTFIRLWSEPSSRQFAPFPLFHAGGLYLFLQRVIYWGNPVAFGIVDRLLSPDLVVECLDNLDVEGASLPSMILEQMSRSLNFTRRLAKLKMVIFGGSELATDAGNYLTDNGVRLVNAISTTEFSPWPTYLQPDPKLWQYFVINSHVFGADWRKLDGSDMYRLVIVRKENNPGYQGCFYTFPEEQEFDTKDLYEPHPNLPDHWKYCGRSDDIITFSNGEKLNPVTIEGSVEKNPMVKSALVFGSNRFQAGLLIEPVNAPKNAKEAEELIEEVWPYVARANERTSAHGQIGKSLIMLSIPQKTLPRGGKGTVQRANAVKLYASEIDKLYNTLHERVRSEIPLDVSSEESLMQSIEEMFETYLDHKKKFEPDTDFFSPGIDSLQIINASHMLRTGLKAAGFNVDAALLATRVIYTHNTPHRLAMYIYSLVHQGSAARVESHDAEEIELMRQLWRKYTEHLPQANHHRLEALSQGQTVILTGSTGMLGSYMLDRLLGNPKIGNVVCLNRAGDGSAQKQMTAMEQRGLGTDLGRCTFLPSDMVQSDFGLGRYIYEALLQKVDSIFLVAWPVNFNIPLRSFEPHIHGVRNAANFATRASKQVSVTFVSSSSTCNGWNAGMGPIPETRLEDLSLPINGYGKSKMVASLVLEDAAKAGSFSATIIRVGQIAGAEADVQGITWNAHDLIPSIVASSLYLKTLPYELGQLSQVDWITAEQVADLVLELAGQGGYFHGVNPESATWSELATGIQDFYGKDRIIRLVGFRDWVADLESSQLTTTDLERNPALKLVDTLRAMVSHSSSEPLVFDLKRTMYGSLTLRTTKAMTTKLMKQWCKQWGF